MASANSSNLQEMPSTSSAVSHGNDSSIVKKYPLQNIWTLWYFSNDRTKSWDEMQTEVASVDTVEDFWCLYKFILPASELKVGSDYSLFKRNIKPMWEDPANKDGGRLLITLPKYQSVFANELWTDIQLLMIGESFDHDDQINGAVINVRIRNYKISIWTSNAQDEEAIAEISHVLCNQLDLRPNMFIYQPHADAMNGNSN